jgi:hypothetical protein
VKRKSCVHDLPLWHVSFVNLIGLIWIFITWMMSNLQNFDWSLSICFTLLITMSFFHLVMRMSIIWREDNGPSKRKSWQPFDEFHNYNWPKGFEVPLLVWLMQNDNMQNFINFRAATLGMVWSFAMAN